MKRIDLFTKEDIEKYGFVYEPDKSKCKGGKCLVVYTTYYAVGNCKFKVYPPVFENNPNYPYTFDDFKRDVASLIHYKYVNSVYVYVPADEYTDNTADDSKSTFHAHVRTCFDGHTNFSGEEWEKHCKEWEERMGIV